MRAYFGSCRGYQQYIVVFGVKVVVWFLSIFPVSTPCFVKDVFTVLFNMFGTVGRLEKDVNHVGSASFVGLRSATNECFVLSVFATGHLEAGKAACKLYGSCVPSVMP